MKKTRLLALVLALGMAVSLGACTPEQDTSSAASSEPEAVIDPNYPVEIGDIRLETRPETVVSLSPAATELLTALGVGDRLEGVSDYCDYPSSVENLTRCGTAATPNLVSIKKLRPQVVFSSVGLSQSDTTAIEELGAQLVVLGRVESIDALEEHYITAATLLDGLEDGKANGEEIFGGLRARYDALCDAADGIADRLSGVYLRMTPLTMATGDTWEGELLGSALGITNDAEQFTGWVYPADQAVNLYPDVIFYDQSIDPVYFKDDKTYNTTDAYKQNRLYAFDALAFERQSPRMFDALEEMFAQAYPDVTVEEPKRAASSDDADADADTASSDEEMLDLDDATEIVEKKS